MREGFKLRKYSSHFFDFGVDRELACSDERFRGYNCGY
jgi:hypothetical protein